MKAIVFEGINKPLVYREEPKPILNPGEALVKIKAAALNRRDWWIWNGKYAGLRFPIIPGSDGTGIVEDINGDTDTQLKWIGKKVIINPALHWPTDTRVQPDTFKILGLPDNGTFAEYIKVPIENLHIKPMHLTDEEAAAIPLAGLTAYRAVFNKGQIKKGEKVLISGIGGGVATFAARWAIHAGAEVHVTSGSTEKITKALLMGAQSGIHYHDPIWALRLKEEIGGFDLIIDSALGEGFAEYPDLANPGGRIVFFGGTTGNIPPLDGRKIFWKQLSIMGTTMGSTTDFEKMLKFIEEHQVKPVIDEVYPLQQIEKALQKMGNSSQFGKLVLTI